MNIWSYGSYERWSHGPMVVNAIEEHVYTKGMNKKVRLTLYKCRICQRVKVNTQ